MAGGFFTIIQNREKSILTGVLDYAAIHWKIEIRKLQVQVGHPAVEKTGSILATVLVEASDSTKIGASAAA